MKSERWHQITEMFHAARERDPERRDAFLAEACREDATLRQEVEAMLAGHVNAGHFGDTPLFTWPASESGTRPRANEGMTLAPGDRLGAYEITDALGAGGMGEVYRAHDTRLSRDVAVKILPRTFADDSERLTRFRHEARVLASLNHPNIAAIYGLERSDDEDHLILELVEGENLAGPVAVGTALDHARQIAEALEAAHSKGIIHRDLKPANVKVTPEGRVKLLDFGLAKAVWGIDARRDFARDVTIGTGLDTGAGRIVGSPAYMSPEQARGDDVDERTDVWAFGCLLYELVTGKRAFPGELVADTIASVLEHEPDWDALPDAMPPRIRDLLRRCLDKDASRRLQTIADARRTIEQTQRGWNRWQVAAIAVAALGTLAVGGVVLFSGPARPALRSEWVQVTKFPDSVSQPALSPDGRMVTFMRGPETFFRGGGQVYVKALPDGEPVQLTHDGVDKMSPAFSPDGAHIAYTTVDAQFSWDTWVVPVGGGKPQPWLRNASGLVWTSPREVLFSEMRKSPHMGIVASDERRIGQRDVYLPAHEHAMAHRSYASPDGKWVLLVEMNEDHQWIPCRVVPMDGSSPGRQVGPPKAACNFGAWSPDGNWMYVTSNAGGVHHIWRQRFPDGQPEQVTSGPTAEEGIAMASDGRSFVTAVALQNVSIWLHDATGERQISSLEGIATTAKFTPDGQRLCYLIRQAFPTPYTSEQPGEVWVADLESGRSQPLAPGFRALTYDVSADSRQIVMEVADDEDKPRLWLVPLDRGSPPRQIQNVEGRQPKFGPDGEIFFRASGFVYRVRTDGTGLRKALEQQILLLKALSPDGRWLVGWSSRPDDDGMATQAFALTGVPEHVTRQQMGIWKGGGSIEWMWSPGGNVLSVSAGPVGVNRTYLIPLPPGEALPPVPAGGFRSEDEIAHLPGARRIDALTVVPGPSPDVYAFSRVTSQRNLYRIPVP
jgi:eukaryotic-like serine/threonine-protein kinase